MSTRNNAKRGPALGSPASSRATIRPALGDTSPSTSPQTLPALECDVCDACGSRVRFLFLNSYELRPPRPGWKVSYLRCPVCGHHATRFEEISAHKSAKKPVRYVYRHR